MFKPVSRSHIAQLYLSDILLSSTLHPIAYTIVCFIQFLQYFVLISQSSSLEQINLIIGKGSGHKAVIYLSFAIETILLVLICLGFNLKARQVRKNQAQRLCARISLSPMSTEQKITHAITSCGLIGFKSVLLLPTTVSCFSAFSHDSSDSGIKALAAVCLAMLLCCIYPLTGLLFWNKLASAITKAKTLSYMYLVNFRSLLFVYAPLLGFLSSNQLQSDLRLFNTLFVCLAMLSLYFHPIITLNHTRITQVSTSLILSTITVSTLYGFLGYYEADGTLESSSHSAIQAIAFFCFCIVSCSFCLDRLITARIKATLKNKEMVKCLQSRRSMALYAQKSWVNNFNQTLFFFLMNLNNQNEELYNLLLMVSNRQQKVMPHETTDCNLKEEKSDLKDPNSQKSITFNLKSSKSLSKSEKNINVKEVHSKQISAEPRQNDIIIDSIKGIFDLISEENHEPKVDCERKKRNSIKEKFKKLVFEILSFQYTPSTLYYSKNLGQNEIRKEVENNQKTYIFLVQTLLYSDSKCSFRQAYYLLKCQNYLQAQRLGWNSLMSSLQSHCLIGLIEKRLREDCSVDKHYNLSAQNYFKFEQNFDQLRKTSLKCCQNSLEFWKEMKYSDTDSKKLFCLIEKNYSLQKSMERQYSFIMDQFPERSPLVISDLLIQYNELVLGRKIPSLENCYNPILGKVREQLEIQKKEGTLSHSLENSENSDSKHFYKLTKDYAVCLVDFEENEQPHSQKGRVKWANHVFWDKYYDSSYLGNSFQTVQFNQPNVLKMLPEQLRDIHLNKYFRQFSRDGSVSYNHRKTYVFDDITNIIKPCALDVQILPTLEFDGFQAIFIFRQTSGSENMSFLIESQSQSVIGYSRGLLEQLTDIDIQTLKSDEKMKTATKDCLQQIMLSNTALSQCLKCPEDSAQKSEKVNIFGNNYNLKVEKATNCNISSFQNLKNFIGSLALCKPTGTVYWYSLSKQYQETFKNELFTRTRTQKRNSFFDSGLGKKNSSLNQQQNNLLRKSQTIAEQNSENDNIFGVKLVELNGKILEKTEEELRLEKAYLILTNCKTANCFQKLKKIAIFLTILLVGSMIGNIVISYYRESVYLESYDIIVMYNSLIHNLTEALRNIRAYNYHAEVFSTDDEQIDYLLKELKDLIVIIDHEIDSLSPLLTDKWLAYEVMPTGAIENRLENDFVILANYILSSITYISQVPPTEMAFPLVLSRYPWWTGLSTTQVKYIEFIYNNAYTCLANMRPKMDSILITLKQKIEPTVKQLYIFPNILGLLCSVLYFIKCVIFEKDANKVRTEIVHYLERVPEEIKQSRTNQLHTFKEKFNPLKTNPELRGADINNNSRYLSFVSKSFDVVPKDSHQGSDFTLPKNPHKKSQFAGENNPLSSDRYFLEGQLKTSPQDDIPRKEHPEEYFEPKKTLEKQGSIQRPVQVRVNISRPGERINKTRNFVIYAVLILPAIAFFSTVLVVGIALNSKVVAYLNCGRQLYAANVQNIYSYVWTLQGTYAEPFPGYDVNEWPISITESLYDKFTVKRKLQVSLRQLDGDSELRKVYQEMSNSYLCSYLEQFNQPSRFYDVKFTKEQCESVGQEILTLGLEPATVYSLDSFLFILQGVGNQLLMTYEERLDFLAKPLLKDLFIISIYIEELYEILFDTFDRDFKTLISSHIQFVLVYSVLMALFTTMGTWYLLKNRKQHIDRDKKRAKSIMSLITYSEIKGNPLTTSRLLKEIDIDIYS